LLHTLTDDLLDNEEISDIEPEDVLDLDHPSECAMRATNPAGQTAMGSSAHEYVQIEINTSLAESMDYYLQLETNPRAQGAFSYRQWVIPVLMVCGFLGGLSFTVGHHVHDAKLHATVVESAESSEVTVSTHKLRHNHPWLAYPRL
jgi:hypothetical protein